MAKKDYTKYTKNQPKVDEIGEPIVEEAVEEVVEVVEEVKPVISGVVVDCTKLNVRVAPNSKADVVCVIDASANIVINEVESTDDFYKICTATGAEGFCMKKFIKILP